MDRTDVVVATTHANQGNPLPELLARELESEGFEVWRRPLVEVVRAARRDQRRVVVLLHWIGHLTRRSLLGSVMLTAKFLALLVALRLTGGRLVWYLHNEGSHEVVHPRLEHALEAVLGGFLSDRIVVMSPEGFDALPAGRRLARARLVLQPSYETVFGPLPDRRVARAALDIPEGATVLLQFGRIRRYKGVPDLLAAVREIPDPDALVVIAGECPDPALAEEILRLVADDDRVVLRLGRVPDDEIPTLLAAADWMILPYRRVLNSAVAMLAVSYGVPVVAPRIGALPYALGDGDPAGILYDGVHSTLLDAIRAALATTVDEREAMSAAADRLRQRSSVSAVGTALATVVDEAAGQRPKRTWPWSTTRRKTGRKSS